MSTWVKVFRFIPEFFYLARHLFCETCKSVEILGGGGGGGREGGVGRPPDDLKGRRFTQLEFLVKRLILAVSC